MSEIQIFNNPQFGEVRVAVSEDNESLFCLADVCAAIGIVNHRNVKARLDEDDVRLMDATDNLGRTQQVTYVTESGLYSVVLRSDAANAKPFRKWVTGDVLPTIRKHGAYMSEQVIERTLSDPDYLIQLATTLKVEKQKRLIAEREKEQVQLQLEAKTEQLDESKQWHSIKRWAQIHRKDWRKYSWRKLKAVSYELGYEVKKIFDANYGEVNIYHVNVFNAVYGN